MNEARVQGEVLGSIAYSITLPGFTRSPHERPFINRSRLHVYYGDWHRRALDDDGNALVRTHEFKIEGFIQLDLSDIPLNAEIASATLDLTQYHAYLVRGRTNDMTFELVDIGDQFDETDRSETRVGVPIGSTAYLDAPRTGAVRTVTLDGSKLVPGQVNVIRVVGNPQQDAVWSALFGTGEVDRYYGRLTGPQLSVEWEEAAPAPDPDPVAPPQINVEGLIMLFVSLLGIPEDQARRLLTEYGVVEA